MRVAGEVLKSQQREVLFSTGSYLTRTWGKVQGSKSALRGLALTGGAGEKLPA